jgi:curli production assembly/transport component CsgE
MLKQDRDLYVLCLLYWVQRNSLIKERGSVLKNITASTFIILLTTKIAFGQLSVDSSTYTIQSDDTLPGIAVKLGDRDFQKIIFQANIDILKEYELGETLKSGMVLEIPDQVTLSPAFAYSADQAATADSAVVSEDAEKGELDKFRAMFNEVVDKEKEAKKAAQEAQKETKEERIDPVLEFEGLILDETRSKMGRNFYDLFYQDWQAPEDASNFTITISEQPSIGRGTQIAIKIDYEQVYSARLQPRYEYIEAVSKQAIARCKNVIQQQASVRNQLMGY